MILDREPVLTVAAGPACSTRVARTPVQQARLCQPGYRGASARLELV